MTMPSSIGNLKNLTSLEIDSSNITTKTLSSIANIRNLKFFTIVNCGCSVGKLPPAIGNMTSLEILDVLECQLSGPIPQEIGKLTSLERLDISMCQLSGPIPQEIGALKKLTSLVLSMSGLSGRIPSSIGNLTQLTELGLDGNYLSGKVNSLIKLKLISITKYHLVLLASKLLKLQSFVACLYLCTDSCQLTNNTNGASAFIKKFILCKVMIILYHISFIVKG
jgi:Leucine-rich repeat (LRR) protein